jgi:protease YdgD
MKRLYLALALLAATMSTASARDVLHGIKGARDQRVPMVATEFPWSALGRLNNGQGGHCSGTLIGPRLVATAAHCFWNNRTQRPMPASAYTFVAGFDRGDYLRASKIAAIHLAPGWEFTKEQQPLSSRANDWALVELTEPMGDEIGWIAPAVPQVGMTVGVAGYGRDKAFLPLAHLGCHIQEQPVTGVLFHDCDAVQGESGGPVLGWVDGQLRLVAVNVAVIPSKGEMGVAASVSPLMAAAGRLGGQPTTRKGPLSAAPSLDLGDVLGAE